MANEITLAASITCYKPSSMSSAIARSIASLIQSMTGAYVTQDTILVGTSATVIPLGAVVTPGYCWLLNLDATNYIQIKNGSGGAAVPRLRPGQLALFPWDDAAVPYAQANTAACLMEVFLLSQ